MSKRITAAKKALIKCHEALGIKDNDKFVNSRKDKYAQTRAAIAVAMLEYRTTFEIADAIGRDRSTISYYKSNHSDNLIHWEGYNKIYETCNPIVNSILRYELVKDKLKYIDDQIAQLHSMRQDIVNDSPVVEINGNSIIRACDKVC